MLSRTSWLDPTVYTALNASFSSSDKRVHTLLEIFEVNFLLSPLSLNTCRNCILVNFITHSGKFRIFLVSFKIRLSISFQLSCELKSFIDFKNSSENLLQGTLTIAFFFFVIYRSNVNEVLTPVYYPQQKCTILTLTPHRGVASYCLPKHKHHDWCGG